ncbi:restriction endonuclease [Phycisphaeraceae bacterium D3-23]
MASKSSGADDFLDELFAMFKALPWWIGPIFVGLAFLLFRFVFPYVLHAIDAAFDSPIKLGTMLATLSSLLAPLFAGITALVWVAALVHKRIDAQRLDKQRSIDTIRELSWREFEQLLAEAYRRQGYRVTDTGQTHGHAQPDGGIDLVLDRDGQRTLVQCKHWKTQKVGVKTARELYGVVASQHADRGVLITSGRFTQQTHDFAQDLPLNLIDGPQLQTLIHSVQRPRNSAPSPAPSDQLSIINQKSEIPACPRCQSPMTRRTARKGPTAGQQFWGCTTYPKCKGTRAMGAV